MSASLQANHKYQASAVEILQEGFKRPQRIIGGTRLYNVPRLILMSLLAKFYSIFCCSNHNGQLLHLLLMLT